MTPSTYKSPIKFLQNIDQKIFKVEYQYFGTFAKAAIRSHNKTFFQKVSRILTEFDKVLNCENLLIYALPKFN